MNAKRKYCFGWMLLAVALCLFAPLPAASQDHGGGGGGGCGDVFGDLIHILRHETTGQPILAQRWVEMPASEPGYGWGYCPIAVYFDGTNQQELQFAPYSCDVDPEDQELIEEVDYFGRLNGGRTKERNHRMHLDEVISNIKQADFVMTDTTGRLKMGFDCLNATKCYEWATVDSPMESMALYTRLMKYGHLGTDPYEIDTWAHGDPKLATQFHPALSEEDWDKFDSSLGNLMPKDGKNLGDCWDYSQAEWFDDADGDGYWDPAEPFYDMNENFTREEHEPFTDLNENEEWDPAEDFTDTNDNGVADEFVYLCADPEHLDNEDLVRSASWLAAAASKTGFATRDLVQYANRILKITQTTDHTASTLDTLPALYRDCWASSTDPEDPPEEGVVEDLVYDSECDDLPAHDGIPNYDSFPDVQELFVDFSALTKYKRANERINVILDKSNPGVQWSLAENEKLLSWVEFVNGNEYFEENIDGFVDATNDVLRSIEYIHNYEIPEDLYCKYVPGYCE